MPSPEDPPDQAPDQALVERLRAAGCVFAEAEARLLLDEARSPTELEAMAARRIQGEPIEYVVGWAAFFGLRIHVEPGVFVPRKRSELLVREALATGHPGSVVLDLCCGSGAIGAAIAANLPVELFATDIDPVAVRCARRNTAAVVFEGDLFEPVPDLLHGRIDLLVINAPYVPTGEIALMPAEARLHEAAIALDGGPDGLEVQRRAIAEAPRWLAPGGHLVIETSERQAPATVDAVDGSGLDARVVHDDDLDATVVVGG